MSLILQVSTDLSLVVNYFFFSQFLIETSVILKDLKTLKDFSFLL